MMANDQQSGTGQRPHHPLPQSDKARHDEIPEHIEEERARGDDAAKANRGERPGQGSGSATGSGSGAGGGGSAEDYDQDPQGGGGKIEQPHEPRPGRGGDAPVGGSH